MDARSIGLIAGNGVLPLLFARSVREQGLRVVAIAHRGETDPSLEGIASETTWVRIGEVDRIRRVLEQARVNQAVMAGGFGRMRAFAEARPDLGALQIVARLRSFRDDAMLRELARYFERRGIAIVPSTNFVKELLAPRGPIAGPAISALDERDVALGFEVAGMLGRADVGQTVVVRNGHVLAVEAVEGTDEAIRRGAKLGGPGAIVVKRKKPGQDERFDLPAIGPGTLGVMHEVKARVLAVEAGASIILEADLVAREARKLRISVLGYSL